MQPAGRFHCLRKRSLWLALTLSVTFNVVLLAIIAADWVQPNYGFLHPSFSSMDKEDSIAARQFFRVDHQPLLEAIHAEFDPVANERFSFYFETLNSGGWVGIRETEKMSPGSLRKVPLLAATFKRIEQREIGLDNKIVIKERHLDNVLGLENAVGPLAKRGAGTTITVREAIELIAHQSDNTATMALVEAVGYAAYADAMFALGLSWKTWESNFSQRRMVDYPLSASEFSRAFRALYYSGYLTPEHSERILRELSNSTFTQGMRAGIPAEVLVSHKTGDWRVGDQHHDCGIVYFPDNPFILCIMTNGLDKQRALKLIEEISRITFDYVAQQRRNHKFLTQ